MTHPAQNAPFSLDAIIDDIRGKATALQDTASNPIHNVWVGASAGTGKTKVLTDRVLRLLLPPREGKADGVDPSRILCITFTKAGAGEMIARIMSILSTWAVCPQSDLEEKLSALLGHQATLKQLDAARRLFASVVDKPEGLTITTIHAFCQSLLGRFPLEAGLSPHFNLIDDAQAKALIRDARDGLIRNIRAGNTDSDLAQAFERLATWKNGESINQLIQIIINDQEKFASLYEQYGSIETIIHSIYQKLDLKAGTTRQSILDDFFGDDPYPKHKIAELAEALSHGAKGNQEKAVNLQKFIALSAIDKTQNYDVYRNYFLKKDGDLYAPKEVTKNALIFNPDAWNLFVEEAKRIQYCDDRLNALAVAEATATILTVAYAVLDRYTSLKNTQSVLDYNDLILKARDLLYSRTESGRMMTDWVLYKIDGGIDHILVDEAQDTNPIQWQIIEKIADEFFSGMSAREHNPERSVFVVGDEKQSIFRFQGAQPEIFDTVKHRLKTQVDNAQRSWQDLPMGTSFRSVGAILNLVDAVFNNDHLKQAVVQDTSHAVAHEAFRYGQSGRIELWPPYTTPNRAKREPWTLPLVPIETQSGQSALAARIAQTIKDWVTNGELLKAKGRPVRYGDIMILLQRRNAFVDHLITEMKKLDVPVSGVDRMVVSDQIAVQDLIAALSFALMPDDDLTLACLLKSPLIGWDDAAIEAYAYNRHPHSLWQQIKSDGKETKVIEWLNGLIESTANQSVFDALNSLLVTPTPNDNLTGWQALISRLGRECVDAVEEVLNMAQNYDLQYGSCGVQGFLHYIESDRRELKRELESEGDQVRIMTVHASKGLQAPIVILPDLAHVPSKGGNREGGFYWTDDGLPLWAKQSGDHCDLYQSLCDAKRIEDMREYNRLLYVALTRAEDRLILCTHVAKNMSEESWYSSVKIGLTALPAEFLTESEWPHDDHYMMTDGAHCLIYETPQLANIDHKEQSQDHDKKTLPLPTWALQTVRDEQVPSKTLAPSKLDDDTALPVRSPLSGKDDTYRFRRGLLTHSLLQYLPDIALEKREETGKIYLSNKGQEVSPLIRDEILKESLAILNGPEFAPFFAEGSQAEVPVTGAVTNTETGKTDIISGQIDRLLVTDDTVWIVDFKSNRPPPAEASGVPAIYKQQLAAYKALMGQIYPDHTIRTALLWTDGPHIMEIMI